ncbi:glycosyltransferase family 2 protein [Richelia sinica]|nr:glycosyltransferase family 2 protein [Richelia sinica]MBD2666509.1 glycosyltransferase family 2 protein [Richelia sinica FACHB-800]
MDENSPLVSVVMTTYNHEKYIAEAINSVLNQSFTNFELIIVNDGSTDRTDEIIKSFNNKRITYIYQENQGTSAAVNRAILASQGKYIAFFSGDDVCNFNRLDQQFQYVSSHQYQIIFSGFEVIDDDSTIIHDEKIENWFLTDNQQRSDIINNFFFRGNCLNAITSFVKRDYLLDVGLFNPCSIQAQDFDIWIKLIKKYDFLIISDKLVKYRIRNNNNNLSSFVNDVRRDFEIYQIYRSIFDDMPYNLFKKSFSQKLKKFDFQDGLEYELEKAFMYLNHSWNLIKIIGCEKLFTLLQDTQALEVANKVYDFGLPQLYSLTKEIDFTNSLLLQNLERENQHIYANLQEVKDELGDLQNQIQAMESSKFWKMKKAWTRCKDLFQKTKPSF